MDATPRVNVPLLENFTNRTVRIVGKVVQLQGNVAVIESAGIATVQLHPNAHFVNGHYFEIVGKVNSDMSIKALTAVDWGTNIDETALNALVDVSHKYRDLFYE